MPRKPAPGIPYRKRGVTLSEEQFEEVNRIADGETLSTYRLPLDGAIQRARVVRVLLGWALAQYRESQASGVVDFLRMNAEPAADRASKGLTEQDTGFLRACGINVGGEW
jgi:hypothetical protein